MSELSERLAEHLWCVIPFGEFTRADAEKLAVSVLGYLHLDALCDGFDEWWWESGIIKSGERYATDNKVAAEQAWQAATKHAHDGHAEFVRGVRDAAQRAEDLAICTSLTSYLANEILALCAAELAKDEG